MTEDARMSIFDAVAFALTYRKHLRQPSAVASRTHTNETPEHPHW